MAALSAERARPHCLSVVVSPRHWLHVRFREDREAHGYYSQVCCKISHLKRKINKHCILYVDSEVRGIFDAEKMVFMDSSLRETPHYSLFSKGKKNLKNCLKTRETCALLETFPEAASCKRGTIKFSTMPPHTHIAPHVGVTNTILQIVVGLDMDSEIGMQVRVGDEQK